MDKRQVKVIVWSLLNMVLLIYVDTLDNGVALLPPMGWMSWERFRCNTNCTEDPHNCLSEKLIVQMCDIMVDEGYREAGYNYIAIDDCWAELQRHPQNGQLIPDRIRFPHGIKYLADYIHSKKMKLGIYGDMGHKTCKGYPGSEFYIQKDAEIFAEWGVDMLKLDCCNMGSGIEQGYETMGFFLNKTGRQILYSCSYPVCLGGQVNYKRVAKTCNMWRNAVDMSDSWEKLYEVIQVYGKNTGNFSAVAGPGQWNDPDQLIVGDYGLSDDQQMVQMAMWAMWSSPLFMSVDLRNIKPFSKGLLLNSHILSINQDPLGIQAKRLWVENRYPPGGTLLNAIECWMKPLSGNQSSAVAILNGSPYGEPATVKKYPYQLGLQQGLNYIFTDVFTNKKTGPFNDTHPLFVRIHGTSVYFAIAKQISLS